MSDLGVPLSIDGEHRREKILALAQAHARRRWRVRTARSVAICFLLAAIMGMFLHRPTHKPLAQSLPKPSNPSAPLIARPTGHFTITYIQTDHGIADRLAISTRRQNWRYIGDDEFLQTLAAAGHPAGLIRYEGQTILVRR